MQSSKMSLKLKNMIIFLVGGYFLLGYSALPRQKEVMTIFFKIHFLI